MITFSSVSEMIKAAEEKSTTISRIALDQTMLDMELSEDEILSRMSDNLSVMKKAVIDGCAEGMRSISGISVDMAYRVKKLAESGGSICGSVISEVIYTALAIMQVNACMGRIVASPTAGSCGIVPACLLAMQNHHNIPDNKIVMGLINASAIGMVIAKNATLSGAEGACQAECGSAAAMAASAVVEVMGGTPSMCGNAAAQALKSLMGLVCDPVAGLVEEPCIIRNPSSATIALCCAEMSLAGVPSVIPIDEVIKAMDSVSKELPASLRETADGGIAASETGRRIAKELQKI